MTVSFLFYFIMTCLCGRGLWKGRAATICQTLANNHIFRSSIIRIICSYQASLRHTHFLPTGGDTQSYVGYLTWSSGRLFLCSYHSHSLSSWQPLGSPCGKEAFVPKPCNTFADWKSFMLDFSVWHRAYNPVEPGPILPPPALLSPSALPHLRMPPDPPTNPILSPHSAPFLWALPQWWPSFLTLSWSSTPVLGEYRIVPKSCNPVHAFVGVGLTE